MQVHANASNYNYSYSCNYNCNPNHNNNCNHNYNSILCAGMGRDAPASALLFCQREYFLFLFFRRGR